jgi:two-component system chemotaxis response regulator CheY
LVVTADANREQIVAAAKAGVDGYMIKPFSAEVLQRKMDTIFSRSALIQARNSMVGKDAAD